MLVHPPLVGNTNPIISRLLASYDALGERKTLFHFVHHLCVPPFSSKIHFFNFEGCNSDRWFGIDKALFKKHAPHSLLPWWCPSVDPYCFNIISYKSFISQLYYTELGRHHFMFDLLYCCDQPCPVRKIRGLEHRRPELGLHCLCPEAGAGGRVRTLSLRKLDMFGAKRYVGWWNMGFNQFGCVCCSFNYGFLSKV